MAGRSERYDEGMRMRRRVLGDAYVDAALSRREIIGGEFQQLVTEYVWGEVWTRDALPAKTRSLITVALLAALGQTEELGLHVGGAVRNGCTPGEIEEALMHAGAYCGASATATAFRAANRALKEMAAAGRPATS
ncbi:MAG: carboxymuconolactone decarboxylase family protein [Chloroflexota bacterium]|nr:carboxymuconolactone decarboxylase family protein [Chloroflexota bacterium]